MRRGPRRDDGPIAKAQRESAQVERAKQDARERELREYMEKRGY